ncbi:extracellular solute-binding protein [Salinilacihabitans rarus]|uniref:extracellular solute-binding protein n=1 Tax=Salinilacihabitans rarus TaxID=2961596 RepID=UPI0020C8E283|nr:extracellular solute-binding protein [Salinilacihabitans rarus]
MALDRRTLVKYVAGASAAGAFAGCISTEDPGSGDEDGGDGGDGGADEYDRDDEYEALEPEEGVDGEATLWHDLTESATALFDGNVDSFNSEYAPTIRADAVAEFVDATTTSIPAGEGPELFLWAHDLVGDYQQNGFLSDQSDEVRVDLDLFGEAADAAQFDGGLYGLPYAAETVALIYNEDYVDEPPETFEEMREIMEEYHDPENGVYGLSHNFDAYFYSAWAHCFGGYYFDDETGELGITNDETIEGLEFVRDELYPYMPQDWEYETQAAIFVDGNAPFAINGPWFLGDVEDFEASVAPFPTVDGNEPSPYTGIQLLYFAAAMDDDEDRAAAARSFAEWYATNTSIAAQMAAEQGYIPVHEAFVEDDEEADELPESVQGFTRAVEQGIPMPTDPRMQDVWEPIETEFEEVLQDNKTVEEAMGDAESQILDAWD